VTSAKTGDGIPELFEQIAAIVLEKGGDMRLPVTTMAVGPMGIAQTIDREEGKCGC
jgi:hypothetical protein